MTIPHMPNFFMVEGPFSPIGNVCAFLTAELQVGHIIKLIRIAAEHGRRTSPREDATAALLQTYREAARTDLGYRRLRQLVSGIPKGCRHSTVPEPDV
jgi:cation diffusion facilitator CzcD-associated flavoprotein CzcO